MGVVTQIAPPVSPGVQDVTGYVEAVTTDRLLGWAWAPRAPELRATVELRLGEEVLARAAADLSREDLARSGIGDGCHAFELKIPHPAQCRAGELLVFARVGDGEAVLLRAPPASEALSDQLARVLRGLEVLMGSQRLLHRNLQAALTRPPEQGSDVAAALADQVSAVEHFVVRLDERLAALSDAGAPSRERRVPRASLWTLAVSGLALLVSIAGLIRSLGG